MPPVKRFLRLDSKRVLELRVFMESSASNISLNSWLLKGTNAALPRIIEAIKPQLDDLIWLSEVNTALMTRTKKIINKHTVTQDDFSVSIFLTEPASQYTLSMKSGDQRLLEGFSTYRKVLCLVVSYRETTCVSTKSEMIGGSDSKVDLLEQGQITTFPASRTDETMLPSSCIKAGATNVMEEWVSTQIAVCEQVMDFDGEDFIFQDSDGDGDNEEIGISQMGD